MEEKLVRQFNEVKDIIPMDKMGKGGKDGQFLYGDVLDWLRDYFGEPKNHLLASMLIGDWFSKCEPSNKVAYGDCSLNTYHHARKNIIKELESKIQPYIIKHGEKVDNKYIFVPSIDIDSFAISDGDGYYHNGYLHSLEYWEDAKHCCLTTDDGDYMMFDWADVDTLSDILYALTENYSEDENDEQ